MKKLFFILLLTGCTQTPHEDPYEFDTAAYARSQGWCGKDVKSPGVYYDKDCVARVKNQKGR